MMLGRLIRKFILACSVAAAIALIVLAVRSRHGDLVVSAAKNATYHELRADRRQIGYTQISRWALDEQPRWGQVNEPRIDPKMFISRGGASPQASMMLLNRIEVTLIPAAA